MRVLLAAAARQVRGSADQGPASIQPGTLTLHAFNPFTCAHQLLEQLAPEVWPQCIGQRADAGGGRGLAGEGGRQRLLLGQQVT